jgi:hypothetical protein
LRGWDATIFAPLAASETVTATSSTVPAPAASTGDVEFGLTAMIGTPRVTLALTV